MLDYFFSFQGRTGRVGYFMYFVSWIFVYALVIAGTVFFAAYLQPLVLLLVPVWWILPFAMVVGSVAVTVRRLHDINLTGWVLPFFWFLGLLQLGLLEYNKIYPNEALKDHFALMAVCIGVLWHFYFVMLLVWPSEDEGNRFG